MKVLFLFTGSQQLDAVTGSFSPPEAIHIWCTLVPKHLSPKFSSLRLIRCTLLRSGLPLLNVSSCKSSV